jgi:hypothetical protein
MKHTPGPWGCVEVEFGDYQTGEVGFVVSSKSAQMVGSVANCRLIAAAPDLLEALEFFVERYAALVNSGDCGNWNPETDAEVIKARAAIKKAKGEV